MNLKINSTTTNPEISTQNDCDSDSKHLLQQQLNSAQSRAAAAAAAASVASTCNGRLSPAASFDITTFNMGHLHGFQVIFE